MYVRRIMIHLLAHCQAAILASSSRHNVQFGSLLVNERALDLRWCGAPPWMTPQDGSHCCRLLIGCRASKAAEILCRFSSGWSASRSQVQPLILAMIQVPEIHNPTSEYCGQCNCCFVWFRILSFFVCGASLWFKWRDAHVPPNLQPSFILGLTHDVRVPTMTRRLRALLFQAVVTRMLLLFSRRTGAFRDSSLWRTPFPIFAVTSAERERGRSCLPFALPLLPSSCLELQESPLEQCPSTNRRLQNPLVFCFRCCFSHNLFVGLELHSRSCLFGSSTSEPRSSSECRFLVHSFCTVSWLYRAKMVRNYSEYRSLSSYIRFPECSRQAFPSQRENFAPFGIKSFNIVAPKGNVHEGSEVQKRFMSTCNTRVFSSILCWHRTVSSHNTVTTWVQINSAGTEEEAPSTYASYACTGSPLTRARTFLKKASR